jgi:hypothetical protein
VKVKSEEWAEDSVRPALSGVKLEMDTSKAELSQAREEQLATSWRRTRTGSSSTSSP